MNRINKYRGWHKKEKLMFTIKNLLSFSNNGDIWINENNQHPINTFYGWVGKDIELMQYTEHDDKNGSEIYDGDLLKVNKDILEVIYINGSPALQYADGKDFYEYLCNLDGTHRTEVVGNKYEH